MHQTTASVAVHDGLVIALDSRGYVHCFDAKTGERHWSHDMLASIYGDPLIVDSKSFVADEDGDVVILELSRTLKVIAEHNLGETIIAPPVFANGKLYIQSRGTLHAIGAKR